MTELPLTGGCLCGGVRYEVTEPLVSAGYCHCTRCQRRSGTAASAQAQVAPGSFRITAGEDLLRAYDPGDGGFAEGVLLAVRRRPSGPGTPPTPMSSASGSAPSTTDPGIRPSYRQFVAYAAPWEPIPDDGLPRLSGTPAAARRPSRDAVRHALRYPVTSVHRHLLAALALACPRVHGRSRRPRRGSGIGALASAVRVDQLGYAPAEHKIA